MSWRATLALVLVLSPASACRGESDLYPASEAAPSAASVERYVRRAHVDLTGAVPDEATIVAARDRLLEDGASAAARIAFARTLVESEAFARKLVDDVRTAAFDGVPTDRVFAIYCRASANGDGGCEKCPFDAADPCACDCSGTTLLAGERAAIGDFAARFAAGEASSTIERELATSAIYQMHGGSVEGLATSLFEDFFDRPPEADEIANVRSCARGSGVSGMGCTLFRENASNYAGMVERAFASEVYREAAVRRVFRQLLGRVPEPVEYRTFAVTSDAPFDVRPLVIKVIASNEYFDLG